MHATVESSVASSPFANFSQEIHDMLNVRAILTNSGESVYPTLQKEMELV